MIWLISFWAVIGFIILYCITKLKTPVNLLQQKFNSLGNLSGKTLAQITSVCGKPDFVLSNGNKPNIYIWTATGYSIELLFDENNICLGENLKTGV